MSCGWCYMPYDSACLGVGTVKSTMATIIGPRELPKPEEATQPSYAPDHSALVGAHFILFLWTSSSLQIQKQFHQESTGSRHTIQMDKHVSQFLATVKPLKENTMGSHRRVENWRYMPIVQPIAALQSITPLWAKGHLCWY